jgi:hypothetical protein
MTDDVSEVLQNEETKESISGHILELVPATKTAWLQEISFFITKVIIILVSSLTAIISIVVKANWVDVIIRTSLAIFVLGLLGWLFNWLLGKYLVEAKYKEMKEMMESEISESMMDTFA